jgi:hypothetical protein
MKHSFTAITKHIARKRVGLSDPRIMHPEREWATGLVIAGCMFLVGAALSANLYIRNRDVSVNLNTTANYEVVYREGAVNDALNYLAAREQRLQELLGTVATAVPEVADVEEITDVAAESEEVIEPEIVEDEALEESVLPSIISE